MYGWGGTIPWGDKICHDGLVHMLNENVKFNNFVRIKLVKRTTPLPCNIFPGLQNSYTNNVFPSGPACSWRMHTLRVSSKGGEGERGRGGGMHCLHHPASDQSQGTQSHNTHFDAWTGCR